MYRMENPCGAVGGPYGLRGGRILIIKSLRLYSAVTESSLPPLAADPVVAVRFGGSERRCRALPPPPPAAAALVGWIGGDLLTVSHRVLSAVIKLPSPLAIALVLLLLLLLLPVPSDQSRSVIRRRRRQS